MNVSIPFRETWLHRVNPGVKLMVCIGLFLVVVLIHNLNIMINVTWGCLLLLIWSGHPWKRLLLYASPFLLMFVSTASGMILFGRGTTLWFEFGLIHITEESFYRGLHLGFRALVLSSMGLLFGLTTRPVMLFYSLMQQWKLSPKYAYSFLAGMRMIPVIAEEFMTLRQALKVRGGSRRKGVAKLYDVLHMYAIPLLAQSIRRAQRIAVAMQAKRFSPNAGRTYYYTAGYSGFDLLFLGYFAAVLWAAWYLGLSAPYVEIADVRLIAK